MKLIIKSALKPPAYLFILIVSVFFDFYRYATSAAILRFSDSKVKLAALIRKDNHRIEKGLALPSPRPWFGSAVLQRLLKNLDFYLKHDGVDTRLLDETHAVLACYQRFFKESDQPPQSIQRIILELNSLLGERDFCRAGVSTINRSEVFLDNGFLFESFAKSRHSIRQFDGTIIDKDTVQKAVEIAVFTPSVCNRCAWRVYNFSDPELKSEILSCQNGNSGFGDVVGNVLVVTCRLNFFEGPGERNQAYVDGGLFAMSLVYALHGLQVASCFLNWSADWFQDRKLRRVIRLPDDEVIITLIAIGGLQDSSVVALSPRGSASDHLISV